LAKRIYWEAVKKFLIEHKISVSSLIIGLIVFLVAYNLIDIISHSGDMVCAGTLEDPCFAEITFLAKEDIFIYPIGYDPYGRNTPFEFDKPLKDWKFYRSWGKGWREIDLTKRCTGSWCGCYWCSKNNLAKYSYVFRAGRIYTIRIEAYKYNPHEDIKWSFGKLDPYWYGIPEETVSYSPSWINRYSKDIDYGNGTHTLIAHIGPQVFWNGTDWQELRFEDHYDIEGYYLIENAHITAYIYDWYTVFYDPDNQRISVDDERWIVEVYNEKTEKWREVDLYNPTLSYANNETHLTVTRTFDSSEGLFNVSYIVWQGSCLKHDIIFRSRMEGSNEFRVTMKLSGIYSDKVRYREGLLKEAKNRRETLETITSEKHIISPYFFIGENNTNLVLSEFLWTLGKVNETSSGWKATTLKDIVFNTHAKGSKADIIIGNYTLGLNESLEIDPTTDTFYVAVGADDGYVEQQGSGFDSDSNIMQAGYFSTYGQSEHVWCRFASVTLPSGATIESSYMSLNENYQWGSPQLKVSAEDDANPSAPTSYTDYIGKTLTSNKVDWDSGFSQTPNLQAIIQELVNDYDYSSGAPIQIMIRDDLGSGDNLKRWDTYEAGYAPALEVTWTVADTTPPTYSDNSTNSTTAGTPVLHSLKWTDETGLATTGGYIFSFDNCTGSFVNDTWTAFSSNPDWSNVTKTINSTVGCTIRWKVYANDTSNNWNASETFSYQTTPVGDTCDCSSIQAGNPIDCSENCDIDACNVGGIDVVFINSGTIIVNGDVTNIANTYVS